MKLNVDVEITSEPVILSADNNVTFSQDSLVIRSPSSSIMWHSRRIKLSYYELEKMYEASKTFKEALRNSKGSIVY